MRLLSPFWYVALGIGLGVALWIATASLTLSVVVSVLFSTFVMTYVSSRKRRRLSALPPKELRRLDAVYRLPWASISAISEGRRMLAIRSGDKTFRAVMSPSDMRMLLQMVSTRGPKVSFVTGRAKWKVAVMGALLILASITLILATPLLFASTFIPYPIALLEIILQLVGGCMMLYSLFVYLYRH